MSSLSKFKPKDSGFQELAKAIKENHSILELDLRGNNINEQSIQKIFQCIQENFVLSDLKIEIHQRKQQ